MPKALHAFALATALVLPLGGALAQEATGVWNTENGKGRVRVSNCGQALCGTLIGLAEPNDDAGKPKTDTKNPDPARRGRALIGIPILMSMAPDGEKRWRGSIYNAEDGKTYAATFTLNGPAQATVEGCVMSVFCRKQQWTKGR